MQNAKWTGVNGTVEAAAEKFLFQASQNNGVLATEITCSEDGM